MAACTDPSTPFEYLIAVTPIIISAAVGFFVWAQAKTAREKLRLDLYNRRLAIYERVVTFYRHNILSVKWENFSQAEVDKMITDLTLATRESRFLFKEGDGVLALLEKFTESVNSTDRVDSLEHLLESIEDKMAPYLNFHSITADPTEGWCDRTISATKQFLTRI